MSNLNFRTRPLEVDKIVPIYRSNEISAEFLVNRAIPQMPTGMEKEEESEHHLQRAISDGSAIPTPEIFDVDDLEYYNKLYPEDYEIPGDLIYTRRVEAEEDIPDYDMDSEDEEWVSSQRTQLELTPDKFEEMIDRLENCSGQTVVTLQEAKVLLKGDDHFVIAVYDYWLNKRLKTQSPLILQVQTETCFGVSKENPYIAFRRPIAKMQTRKDKKIDESSYQKMLKLKRDLAKAAALMEMVKNREKSKRDLLHLTIEVFEKRFQAQDYSGKVVAEALPARPRLSAFNPLIKTNSTGSAGLSKDDLNINSSTQKDKKRHDRKRPYRSLYQSTLINLHSKRKRMASTSQALYHRRSTKRKLVSSEEEEEEEVNVQNSLSTVKVQRDEGPYAFKRKKHCEYHAPIDDGNWFCCSPEESGLGDERFRFCPTSISNVRGTGYRNVGMTRRRVGRGGRVILDRMSYQNEDDFWRTMGYSVMDSASPATSANDVSSNNSSVVNPFAHPLPIESDGISPEPSGLSPPDPSSSNSLSFANTYSEGQKCCLHFRPKTPEEIEPDELRIPSETMIDSSDDDLEEEDSYNKNMEVMKSKPALELGPYLGAVVSAGERPLIFETQDLLEDSLIYDRVIFISAF